MKLKVKMRKEDKQPLIPALIATAIFGVLGIVCLVGIVFFILNFNLEYFIEVFSAEGMTLTIVFGLGMLGLYLVYLLLKFPGEYIGTLNKKENIDYRGKNIWQMNFQIKGEEGTSITVSCYTENENELEVGKDYAVLLKEFNWQIKSIGSLDENKKYNLVKTPSLKPVFYLFFFMFGSGVLFLLFKILYDLEKGNDYFINLLPLVICSVVLFYIYKSCYGNPEESNSEKSSLEETIDETKKYH